MIVYIGAAWFLFLFVVMTMEITLASLFDAKGYKFVLEDCRAVFLAGFWRWLFYGKS